MTDSYHAFVGANWEKNCYLIDENSTSQFSRIVVDILKQTNFFRAFTASSTIPTIYIQISGITIVLTVKLGGISVNGTRQWFDLIRHTQRALRIHASR
ncbi:hypothetical protein Tco_0740993 [Tanacetum coccineum]